MARQDAAIEFARYAYNLTYDKLPASTVEHTKKDIFDSLSTGIAGSSALGISEVMELAEGWCGKEEATSFVFGKKLLAQDAAMVNAAMIHGYDYDDTHEVAMMHCGCIAVSTALAAAEYMGGISGKEFITAVTIALDIQCRLGISSTIGIVESGYIYTPLLGIFAGTLGAGKIMGLSEEQLVNALGIAYSLSAGNYQVVTDSAWTKRLQPGFAAKNAIMACEMAKKGIVGPKNVFEGKYGLYNVYLHGRLDADKLCEGLGEVFTGDDLAFKPWPCGRPSQPPINAAIEVYEKYQPDPAQIEKIEIEMNEHLIVAGFLPAEERQHPKTIVNAQFSIPYGVACSLVNGRFGLADFTEEAIRRPEIQEISGKVNCVVNAEIEKEYHARTCPVIIHVYMKDGTVYDHRLDTTAGCNEKPMSEKAIMDKMDDCIATAALKMAENTAETIKNLVEHLEDVETINEIMKAMLA